MTAAVYSVARGLGLALLVVLAPARPVLAEPEQLQVMLQGRSAAAMRTLVEAEGGTLSHFLPIIDAVGAELTREQLDRVLSSEQVDRHIDDLSVNPEDNAPDVPPCEVGGALELDFNRQGFDWRLYNKQEKPAVVTRVSLTWPDSLGRLESLAIAGKALTAAELERQSTGDLALDTVRPGALTVPGNTLLSARFQQSPRGNAGTLQSAIEAKIAFEGGCEVASVPAYEDNHGDFYYTQLTEADQLHRHGIRGAGVTVAVLDSGLWEHESLAKDTQGRTRVLARYDAIADQIVDEAFDESGHGTHLTSVIAHSGPTLVNDQATGSFKGIAPDTRLVVVKAFNVEGQGDMLDIVRGVQWVVDNREAHNIRVLNLSFASRPRWPYWLDPVNQAVIRAWAAGIVVVAAAGNEGPDPMTVGSPGNLPYIISVGAITDSWTPADRSDDYIPDFSSRGPTPEAHIKPDLVAPGGHMTGLTRPGSTLTLDHPEYRLRTGEFVMTGSSQAAALVSGLVALLLQLEPELSPDQVKCMLTSTAEPAINRDGLLAYSPFEQGYGLVSVTRAITLGDRDCGNVELNIDDDIAGTAHFEGPATVDEDGAVTLPGLDRMLSPEDAAKGPSDSRVWGVKAHVERLPQAFEPPETDPFNWLQVYEEERARIEALRTRNSP